MRRAIGPARISRTPDQLRLANVVITRDVDSGQVRVARTGAVVIADHDVISPSPLTRGVSCYTSASDGRHHAGRDCDYRRTFVHVEVERVGQRTAVGGRVVVSLEYVVRLA